ncbi:MAG: histidine phosphatase family protein [Candidatus Omnitrophota bacterium]
MKITRLTLIRHGITRWNKAGRYCGCKDVALSREGRAQAKLLAKRLKGVKFDRIYSSDRLRALQTAGIVFNKAEIVRASSLREINFGVLEGLRHKEIMIKYPTVYRRWIKDPYQGCIPKAESMDVFNKRVSRGIEGIVRKNPGREVAIVCHGGVISALVCSILKRKNFWRYVPKGASLTVIEYKDNQPKIREFNETKHLK